MAAISPLAFTTPGFAEIVFLVLLALLIFGPEKLPGMARSAGKTLSRFKAEANSTLDELKSSVDVEELRRTASVDELRDVADELRSTSAELERGAGRRGTTSTPRARAGQPGQDAPTEAPASPAQAPASPAQAPASPAQAPASVDAVHDEDVEEPAPFDPDAT